MKVQFATVGHSAEPILLGVKSIGADRMYLFATNDSQPTAIEIGSILSKLLIDVRPIVLLEPFDMVEGIKLMVKTIREALCEVGNGAELYFNITGGTKIMTTSALIASYMEGVKPYYVVERPSEVGPIVMLPSLPKGIDALSNTQKKIIVVLKKLGSANILEIAKEVKMSVPSAKDNIDRLLKLGVVEPTKGRGRKVKLTELGDLWAWLIELS